MTVKRHQYTLPPEFSIDLPHGAWERDIDVVAVLQDPIKVVQPVILTYFQERRLDPREGGRLLGLRPFVDDGSWKSRDECMAPCGAVTRPHPGLFIRSHRAYDRRGIEPAGQAGSDRHVAAHTQRHRIAKKLGEAFDTLRIGCWQRRQMIDGAPPTSDIQPTVSQP